MRAEHALSAVDPGRQAMVAMSWTSGAVLAMVTVPLGLVLATGQPTALIVVLVAMLYLEVRPRLRAKFPRPS